MKTSLSNFKPIFAIVPTFVVVFLAGCGGGGGGGDVWIEPPVPTAEAICARIPSAGYGNYFYCGTTQGNLQLVNFPDGARGYCMTADRNLGLVGYSVTTYNGGATPVMSQSEATDVTLALGSQSSGYVRCTRQ